MTTNQDNPSSPELRLDGSLIDHKASWQDLAPGFFDSLARTPNVPVVLDLTSNSILSSQSIGGVVALHNRCLKEKRGFRIEIGNDYMESLFKQLRLDQLVRIVRVGGATALDESP